MVTGSVIPVPKQRLCASSSPGARADPAQRSVGATSGARSIVRLGGGAAGTMHVCTWSEDALAVALRISSHRTSGFTTPSLVGEGATLVTCRRLDLYGRASRLRLETVTYSSDGYSQRVRG